MKYRVMATKIFGVQLFAVESCQYHVVHAGGRSFDTFPVNSYEAESRRLARFFRMGHTPKHVKVKSWVHNTDHPFMLDLRRK